MRIVTGNAYDIKIVINDDFDHYAGNDDDDDIVVMMMMVVVVWL